MIYGFVILAAGLICLVHFLTKVLPSLRGQRLLPLPAWTIPPGEFFLGAAALAAAVMAVQIPVAGMVMEDRGLDEATAWDLFLLGSAFHLTALAVYCFLRLNFPEQFALTGEKGQTRKWERAALAGGYAFLLAMPVIAVVTYGWKLLLRQLDITADRQETVLALVESESTAAFAAMFFLTVVVAPVTEELIFRGCLYRFMKSKLPALAAMAGSAALFAAMHQNLFAFVPLFILGMLLALAYERSGSLIAAITLHALFNFNTVFTLFLFRAAV